MWFDFVFVFVWIGFFALLCSYTSALLDFVLGILVMIWGFCRFAEVLSYWIWALHVIGVATYVCLRFECLAFMLKIVEVLVGGDFVCFVVGIVGC